MVLSRPFLEQAAEPCGRDLRAMHLMIEPLTDIDIEPSPFKIVQE